jgi:hypothetical protein
MDSHPPRGIELLMLVGLSACLLGAWIIAMILASKTKKKNGPREKDGVQSDGHPRSDSDPPAPDDQERT